MQKTYLYIIIGCSVLGSIALLIFAVTGFFHGAILSLLFNILLWCNFFLIGKSASHESRSKELDKIAMKFIKDNGRLLQQVETLQAIIDAKMPDDSERHTDTEEAANSNI